MKNKRGRPPKFNEERAERILACIEKTVPYKIASESNGVADSTFYSWLDRGLDDMKNGKLTEFSSFLESLRKIQANIIIGDVEEIVSNKFGHKGKEWRLERAHWKYFSPSIAAIELNERLEKLENVDKED